MSLILSTTATYVALKFVDQFIKEEGYGRIKKFFFPTKKYKNTLVKIIYETVEEFEKNTIIEKAPNKFPFYHSQILFDELNKYILFNNAQANYSSLIELLKTNSNISIPNTIELEIFYKIFTDKINNDNKLKKLFIEENYKAKIFIISETINRIETKIDKLHSTFQTLYSEKTFQPNETWFKEQCRLSIDDLGKRYTSELNVKLEVSEIFEGLGKTEEFKSKVIMQVDQFLIKGKKVLKNKSEVRTSIESLENIFDKLQTLLQDTDLLECVWEYYKLIYSILACN